MHQEPALDQSGCHRLSSRYICTCTHTHTHTHTHTQSLSLSLSLSLDQSGFDSLSLDQSGCDFFGELYFWYLLYFLGLPAITEVMQSVSCTQSMAKVLSRLLSLSLSLSLSLCLTGVGFGAGVLLDPSDNLFIIGGADSTLSEREELFVFQLRDPFYKHCSATGSALTAAKAGVKSIFYLQCMDNFMQPADGATFKVDIAGPVGMIPGIVSLGDGKYSCSFTPEKVGAYVISIYVGRGGAKYQDLITGRDTEQSNDVHEFEKQCDYQLGVLECKSAQELKSEKSAQR